MKPTFLQYSKPLLTVMLQCETPEVAIGRIRNALCEGGEAFGLQVESLRPEYHTPEVYRKLLAEMRGRPCYATYYRSRSNQGKTDEEIGEGLVTLAQNGATLLDVIGDLYDRQPDELALNPAAIEKQKALIERIHAAGGEVLMSSHIMKFTPAQRVLEIAFEQKRRGADVIKIVTGAETMEEQIENLRITDLLHRELGSPFLFLSGGECRILRRLGINLGCCMCLCVYEHDSNSTAAQPLLRTMKQIRDQLDF